VPANTAGWIQGCINTPAGQRCTAPCDTTKGYTGNGYSITCGATLSWDVANIAPPVAGGTGCTLQVWCQDCTQLIGLRNSRVDGVRCVYNSVVVWLLLDQAETSSQCLQAQLQFGELPVELLNLETLQCNVPQCRCYRLQQQQHYTDAWGPNIMCFAALLSGCYRVRQAQADSCIAP
jgi:hypothetical protein